MSTTGIHPIHTLHMYKYRCNTYIVNICVIELFYMYNAPKT